MNTSAERITEQVPTMDNMIQAMAGLNSPYVIPTITPPTEAQADDYIGEYKQSTDERVWSDFGIDGSEKEFKQDALLRASGSPLGYKSEQERKQADIENLRDVVDQVSNDMREAQERLEKMHNIGEYQFSDADLDDALQDFIENKEQMQAQHGLTDDQSDSATYHSLMMLGMTPSERENYLENLLQTEPDVANAILQQAQDEGLERESSLTQTETSKLALDADEVMNDILSGADNESFSALTKTGDSGTSNSFNFEAIGGNVASNDAPTVSPIENEPAPF